MPRANDVPGTQDRRAHTAAGDRRLTGGPGGDVGAHHGCRLRNADVHEVGDRDPRRRVHRGADRREIDRLEVRRLRWTGVRRTDQVNEGVAGLQAVNVKLVVA